MALEQEQQKRAHTYRSRVRDEPRRISAGELPGKRKHTHPLRPGALTYGHEAIPLSIAVEAGRAYNRDWLGVELKEERDRIIGAIDDLHTLASQFVPIIYNEPYALVNDVQELLYPCFHKSLLTLYVAQSLTFEGLYGPARPLMRQAFEFLIIAKFCSSHPEAEVFDKWMDKLDVYLANAILKKVKRPVLTEIGRLWRLLSEWTHSTSSAAQPNLDLAGDVDNVELNAVLIAVLIRFADHLLRSHIVTPSVRYYGKRYRSTAWSVAADRRLKQFFAWSAQSYAEGSKHLVREYRSRWTIGGSVAQ